MATDLRNWTPGGALMGGPGGANTVTHSRSRISPDEQIEWHERVYGDGRREAVFTLRQGREKFATEDEARAALAAEGKE
jgi:hypothetical protein